MYSSGLSQRLFNLEARLRGGVGGRMWQKYAQERYVTLHFVILYIRSYYIMLHYIVLRYIILYYVLYYMYHILQYIYILTKSIHKMIPYVFRQERGREEMVLLCVLLVSLIRQSSGTVVHWHRPCPKAMAGPGEFLSDPVLWVSCSDLFFIHCQLNFLEATFECFWSDSTNPLQWVSMKQLIQTIPNSRK